MCHSGPGWSAQINKHYNKKMSTLEKLYLLAIPPRPSIVYSQILTTGATLIVYRQLTVTNLTTPTKLVPTTETFSS